MQKWELIIKKNKRELKFNKKIIFLWLDEILKNSVKEGNLHFFITINFQKNIKELKDLGIKIEQINEILIKNIELLSWYHICWEKNENNNYHLHIICGIRSFIGINYNLKDNIETLLKNNYEIDTKIDFLKKQTDVKKSWKYIWKNYKKEENSIIFCITRYLEYFKDIIMYINIYNLNNKNQDIIGINIEKEEKENKNIILFWDYYLTMNNFYIYNNNVYKKIENSMISFKKIYKKEKLFDDFENIYEFFLANMQTHFKNFNISLYMLMNLINKKEKLNRLIDFTRQKIEPDFNVMEFIDGVYFIQYNKFIRKDRYFKQKNIELETILNIKKITTIKYYNCTFNNISNPKTWIEGLTNILKINKNIKINKNNIFQENKDAIWIPIYMANVFHYGSNELKKKKTLYIWGDSNTGKTTMVVNVLINYFGEENVGLISGNKNFEYQNIIKKKLIVLDEFDFNTINVDNIKKLISGELILGEQKNKDAELIEKTPVIISSNKNIEQQLNNEDYYAIENRVKTVHFLNKIKQDLEDEQISKKLMEEEAKIVVFCNRVYFNWIKLIKAPKKKFNMLK